MKENLKCLLSLMQSYSRAHPVNLPYPKFERSIVTRPNDDAVNIKPYKRSPTLVTIEEESMPVSKLKYFIEYIFKESQNETSSNELKKTEIGNQLIDAINQLISKCTNNKKVISIILDSVFPKQFDLGKSPLEKSNMRNLHIVWHFLMPTFMDYLEEKNCSTLEGFQALKATSLISFFSNLFSKLNQRKFYNYQVTYFVNSPYWGDNNTIKIGKINLPKTINPLSRMLYANYASDKDLDQIKANFPTIEVLNQINIKFYYFIEIELDVKKDEIEQLFLKAEQIGQKLQTNLRLVYDLGASVSCLEFIACAPQTPDLLGTTVFDPKYSFSTVTRRWFYPKLFDPFKKNIGQFAYLCRQTLEPPGLEIATRRFNSAIDRFLPLDPEKSLDIAIALESLFLNNTSPNTELTFRLQLRAAYFLETKYEKRHEIFQTLKVLYNNRSRIVHGGKLKKTELNKTIKNNEKSLAILKTAVIKFSSIHVSEIKNWTIIGLIYC